MVIAALFAVAAIAAIEILSLVNSTEKIAHRCEVNMDLVEPDEVAAMDYRIFNKTKWPLMFVSYSFAFSEAVEVRESDEWKERYGSGGLLNEMYGRDVFIMPRKGVKGRIRFSVKRRGSHDLGKIYLEVGDFLGLKSHVVSYDLKLRVVCTARLSENEPDIAALGGLMGEMAAKRFICEDPSLVLGYGEYTGTEPLKSISWTQTAKVGRLMVKKHDFTLDNDVAIIVDMEHTGEEKAERCLSLIRTACECLEEAKIPYSLRSNGDLFGAAKGVGRMHLFDIQRRIGISHFIKYQAFDDLVSSVLAERSSRGYILIVPENDRRGAEAAARLKARADTAVCVLCGEEAGA